MGAPYIYDISRLRDKQLCNMVAFPGAALPPTREYPAVLL